MGHNHKPEIPDARPPAGAECAPAFKGLYAELRWLAHRQLGGAPRTTLCTTALVHEAWFKIANAYGDDKTPTLALAAKAMRQVVIDHVRQRDAAKRGGGARAITLDTGAALVDGGGEVDLLSVEQGLVALEKLDPRLVSVVECHFFAGMDFAEIGATLGLSERTVQRDWRRARAFLRAHLAEMRA